MSGRSSFDDPLKGFAFRAEVEGFTRVGFTEISGLEAAIEEVKYREGGNNSAPQISGGLVSFPNITMKRGKLASSTRGGDDEMENWFQQSFEMNAEGSSMEPRRTIDIILLHKDGSEAKRYRLFEGLCINYKPFSGLNGSASENLIEEIVVVYEGFETVT